MLIDAIPSELGVTAHLLYMTGTFALLIPLAELFPAAEVLRAVCALVGTTG